MNQAQRRRFAFIVQDMRDGYHPTRIMLDHGLTPRGLQAILLTATHARRTPAPARGTVRFWVKRFRELGHLGVDHE